MKIKRFIAPNMRQALRKVREEQGPDAVILSNERVAGGIEIIAAVDYDESLIHQALTQLGSTSSARSAGTPSPEPAAAVQAAQAAQESGTGATTTQTRTADLAQASVAPPPADPPPAESAPTRAVPPAPGPRLELPKVVWAQEPAMAGMQREMAELRAMLGEQLSCLAWRDRVRRDPAGGQVMRVLCGIGIRADIARRIAGDVAQPEPARAVRAALGALSALIPTVADDLLADGGVLALVGPTGVGKTTTVAKLAARFALTHGRDQLALVSTDTFRIGAREQLLTFGRILGVPVHMVNDETELPGVLDDLDDKRLILIDTAGMSQRDRRLTQQLAIPGDRRRPIRLLLTLAANCQRDALEDAVRRFADVPLAGCVLTKVDEAGSLGGALTALIRHHLPLAFITDGQRVPEDLQDAAGRQGWLVEQATRLFRELGEAVEDDEMAVSYGEVAAHA